MARTESVDELPLWLLSDPERLKRLDGLKREFGHLLQRFDDRLAFERLPLAEQYLSGGLALACYFEVAPAITDSVQHAALPNNQILYS